MANKKSSKTQKNIEKYVKKMSPLKIFILLTCLIVGIGAGIGTAYFLTRNDKFELVGNAEIVLKVSDTYNEQGAVCVAFGKDVTDDIVIVGEPEANADGLVEGVYVVKYTIDNFRYKGYTLYRQIIVEGVEE
ncbi:MAG: DUF5011 domain-containing protein [Clostridiales bacterium]|nr:DUF5011 domain-containing protein [Clostridiales bacterium]